MYSFLGIYATVLLALMLLISTASAVVAVAALGYASLFTTCASWASEFPMLTMCPEVREQHTQAICLTCCNLWALSNKFWALMGCDDMY